MKIRLFLFHLLTGMASLRAAELVHVDTDGFIRWNNGMIHRTSCGDMPFAVPLFGDSMKKAVPYFGALMRQVRA